MPPSTVLHFFAVLVQGWVTSRSFQGLLAGGWRAVCTKAFVAPSFHQIRRWVALLPDRLSDAADAVPLVQLNVNVFSHYVTELFCPRRCRGRHRRLARAAGAVRGRRPRHRGQQGVPAVQGGQARGGAGRLHGGHGCHRVPAAAGVQYRSVLLRDQAVRAGPEDAEWCVRPSLWHRHASGSATGLAAPSLALHTLHWLHLTVAGPAGCPPSPFLSLQRSSSAACARIPSCPSAPPQTAWRSALWATRPCCGRLRL